MYIPIQAAVPYEDSLIWQQHQNYYQQQGLDVFLNQDVPYNISSNPSYAGQVARLFLSALPDDLPEQLPVLEVGAGSGIFAINFLQALEDLAPEIAPRVTYWLSDYAPATIHSLSQHPAFQTRLETGQIKLYIMNGDRPESGLNLSGEVESLVEIGFQLVIANYYFSVLPTAVLHRQGQQWFKHYLALDWLPCGEEPEPEVLAAFVGQVSQALLGFKLSQHLPAEHPQLSFFRALEQAQQELSQDLLTTVFAAELDFRDYLETELSRRWAQALQITVTEQMQETIRQLIVKPLLQQESYDPATLEQSSSFRQSPLDELVSDDLEAQAIEALTQDFAIATVGYSAAGLISLEALLQLLCPAGLMLISDKAYADATSMQGMHPEPVARHGATLSHPVNFPLFEAVLTRKGMAACRTSSRSNALQSLLVCKGSDMPAALAACFEQHFIVHPGHEISHALLEGGHALLRQNQMEAALRSFEKALAYRPGDGTLQYFTALCYLEQNRYSDAIALLTQPHDDLYGLLNRAILLAEAYRLIGQEALAIPAYTQALTYGHDSLTLYHLAQCQLQQGNTEAALSHLTEAQVLNPADADIRAALAELKSE